MEERKRMPDYPEASEHFVPRDYMFESNTPIALVIHKTGGDATPADILRTFLSNPEKPSAHYGVGTDGDIWQYVPETLGAGANCCVEAGYDPFWKPLLDKYGDLNKCTLAVEHCDASLTNSTPLTPAQQTASFKLIAYLVTKHSIPLTHIKPHSSIDPLNRKNCPGNYPWDDLFTYLRKTLLITHNGAILDLPKSYQLDGGSQDKCGPWAVAELYYAGLPGHGQMGNAAQVQAWAHQKYVQYIGPDILSDQNGSSIDNMHQYLKDAGLHWFDIVGIAPGSKQADDLARLHRATDAGYPVLVTVNELSVKRRDGSNPYPWQPRLGAVNHIFTVVGHTNDGYLLIDDELNPNDTWPDQYSEASIECHWACIVQVVGPNAAHPWLAPIPGGDPLTWAHDFTAQLFSQPLTVGVPAGWHDDGMTLVAPNGKPVVRGFRAHVLASNWQPGNHPVEAEIEKPILELSNPSLGAGTRQRFNTCTLEWTQARGVFEAYTGPELLLLESELEKANRVITTLKTVNAGNVGSAIATIISILQSTQMGMTTVLNDLNALKGEV
jgi:hypothetical protein